MSNELGIAAQALAIVQALATKSAPISVAAPRISGTPVVGGTLTARGGEYTSSTTARTYRWLKNGSAIAGATSASYIPVSGDLLASIVLEETPTNAIGVGTSVLSKAVTIQAAPSTGDGEEGSGGDPTTPAFYLASSRTFYPGHDGIADADGTYSIQRQRICHFNDTDQVMGRVQLLYVNRKIGVNGEVAGVNSFQVRASIEYPAGTYHQALDDSGGTATLTASPRLLPYGMTTADSVNILPGEQFWEVVEVLVPTLGQVWPNCISPRTTLGEAVERDSANTTDKTLGGTITNAGGGMYGASAIKAVLDFAPPLRVMLVGNSIAASRNATTVDARGAIGWPAASLSGRAPFIWSAYSGSSLGANVSTNYGGIDGRLALANAAGVTHLHCEWAINDFRAPRTEAQMTADLATLKDKLDAYSIKLVLNTCGPSTTQTDALPPISATQSPYNSNFAPGSASAVGVYNTKVRALTYGNVAYIENADALETGRDTRIFAGIHSGLTDDTSGDLLHPNDFGHNRVKVNADSTWQAIKGTPHTPVIIFAPAITGTPQVSYTLTCSTGTWAFAPVSYAYQWLANGSAIPDATSSTYTLTSSELGAQISCIVTATNAGGSTNSASAYTAAVEAAPAYSSEAAALFAAMTSAPTDARKTQIDTLISGLKTDGVWAKLAVLEIFAAHNEQAAKLEWKTATQKVTVVNSPVYTVDRGYALVVASSQYIKTGITASALGTVSQNSLSHGLFIRAGTTTGVALSGLVGASGRMHFMKSGSGGLTASVNDAGATQLAAPGTAAPLIAHHAMVRSGAAATAYYVNGSLIASLTTASNGIESAEHVIGLSNASYSDVGAFAFWVADGTLTATEVTALHNRLATYKAALGA